MTLFFVHFVIICHIVLNHPVEEIEKVDIDETELAALEDEILNEEPDDKENEEETNDAQEDETNDKSEHEQVYYLVFIKIVQRTLKTIYSFTQKDPVINSVNISILL